MNLALRDLAATIGAIVVAALLLPDFTFAITAFHPLPLFYGLCALLVGILIARILPSLGKIVLSIPNKEFDLLAFFVGFVATLLVNRLVFEAIPHITDSITYLFMAKMFARGMLYMPEHPFPEFVTYHFFINDGKFYGIFPPGWPAVLAIGVLIGAPYIITPVLSGLLVVITVYTARLLFSERVARFVPLLFVLSPFFLFQGSEFMSHPLAALLVALIVWQTVWGMTSGFTFYQALIISGSLGILILTRPFEAVLVASFLLVVVVWGFTKRLVRLSHILVALAILGASSAILLTYNWVLTGDPFLMPQQLYFQKMDSNPNCHRIGFGKDVGCRFEHKAEVYEDGYNLKNAVKTTHRRLQSLETHFMPHPAFLLLVAAALLRRRKRASTVLCLGWFLAFLVWYALFYYHGNCYGPRFLYSALPALIMVASNSLDGLASVFELKKYKLKVGPILTFTIIATAIMLAAEASFPPLIKTYHRFRGIDRTLERKATKHHISDAVIFIPGDDIALGLGFIFNEPNFDTEVVYARSWGDQDYLFVYYSGKKNAFRWAGHRLEFVRYEPELDPDFVEFEAESKQYTLKWCNRCSRPETITASPMGIENAGDDRLLFLSASNIGDWFGFRFYLFRSGTYDLTIRTLEAAYCANFAVYIDNRYIGTVNAIGSEEPRLIDALLTGIYLSQGKHTIRFQIASESAIPDEYNVGIDLLQFELRKN